MSDYPSLSVTLGKQYSLTPVDKLRAKPPKAWNWFAAITHAHSLLK